MKRRFRFLVVLAWGALVGAGPARAHEHEEEMARDKPVFAGEKIAHVSAAYERDVKPIVRAKCWDCHGNETHYPWYHGIPGIGGMIDDDIAEAREHLNFTPGFPFETEDDPAGQLTGLESVALRGWMPPKSYKFMHPSSKISDADRAVILSWVSDSRKTLGIRYHCPMHPELVSEGPSRCPQCGMKLVLKIAAPELAPAKAVKREAKRESQPAKKALGASYTCSMHPEVVSEKPGDCPKCGMKLEPLVSSPKSNVQR